ncbi:MAG: zinc ribbon domain-containing protein [Lachnospiraceae bacterium]|nr:zinc ribbon domain-containing protein [Lachnospiraceae bacterium]
MRIIDMTCQHCGASLQVNDENKQAFCTHCGSRFLIDDEIRHIQYDNAEEAGYAFEKGRLRAQNERIIQQGNARRPTAQFPKTYHKPQMQMQPDPSDQNVKKKNSFHPAYTVIGIFSLIFGIILMLVCIICLLECLLEAGNLIQIITTMTPVFSVVLFIVVAVMGFKIDKTESNAKVIPFWIVLILAIISIPCVRVVNHALTYEKENSQSEEITVSVSTAQEVYVGMLMYAPEEYIGKTVRVYIDNPENNNVAVEKKAIRESEANFSAEIGWDEMDDYKFKDFPLIVVEGTVVYDDYMAAVGLEDAYVVEAIEDVSVSKERLETIMRDYLEIYDYTDAEEVYETGNGSSDL